MAEWTAGSLKFVHAYFQGSVGLCRSGIVRRKHDLLTGTAYCSASGLFRQ